MSSIIISDSFDGGNIDVVDASDPRNIQLNIKPDNASDFFQWFYFRLEGQVGQRCRINIMNAGQAAFLGAGKTTKSAPRGIAKIGFGQRPATEMAFLVLK